MVNSLRLINLNVKDEFFILVKKIITRKLAERGCVLGDGGPVLTLIVHNAMSDGAYRVEPDKIIAGDASGIMAGLGRYLNECRFDGFGSFIPANGIYELVPKKPIRGMYFASHFYNFYHVAPIEKVYEILEDLALRGCNALMAWYDMHHYYGVDDPESVKMIERLKMIYRRAKELGMLLTFGTLANEAFAGTPDNLKAEWRAVNGYKAQPQGHYHVEICPSAIGGIEEIIRQRRTVLRAFNDIPFDFVSYWPYDQGGCTCEDCKPWGANGFLKLAPHFHKVVREELPGAKILCSTWYFNNFIDGEWDAFYERMKDPQFGFFAYLFGYFSGEANTPDFIRRGSMPGGKQMLSFPEISMRGAVPWGGFGANPMPDHLEKQEKANGWFYQGGFPYSEGIYEDINKALALGFASGQYNSSKDILNDYVRYEFSTAPEEIVSLLYDMEDTLFRNRYDENDENQNYLNRPMPPDTVYRFKITDPEKIDAIYERATRVDAGLPQIIRSGWRWRVIFLRAVIDHELFHNGGIASALCEKCYAELTDLYYAHKAEYAVAPPTKEAMALNRGGFLL